MSSIAKDCTSLKENKKQNKFLFTFRTKWGHLDQQKQFAERPYQGNINKQTGHLEYEMSFSHVEISGVEPHRPSTSDSCLMLGCSAELTSVFDPESLSETFFWLSHRILPSDRDLLMNDLKKNGGWGQT